MADETPAPTIGALLAECLEVNEYALQSAHKLAAKVCGDVPDQPFQGGTGGPDMRLQLERLQFRLSVLRDLLARVDGGL